ncbi:MAG: hypothetical protein ACHQZQ_04480 [SAR324 cluster bacterium]
MTGALAEKQVLRSMGAVAAGILANFVIAIPIDVVLHVLGIFPPWNGQISDPLAALALSYRVVAAVAGGYITARLAPQKPVQHALILGVIGVLLSSAGAAAMWDKGTHWYPLALIVISLPCSWLGGKLALRKPSAA